MVAEEHHKYLKIQIDFCKIWDLWPTKDKRIIRRFFRVSFIAINLFNLISTIGIFLLTIITNFDDVEMLATVVDFSTVSVGTLFRYCHILIYGEEYEKLVRFMDDNFLHKTTDKTINMNEYRRKGTIFGISYLVLIFLIGCQLLITSLIKYHNAEPEMQKNLNFLPFNLTYPFDISPPSVQYFLTVHQCFFICIVIFGYGAIDGFWWMVIVLTITQYQIISRNLRNIQIILNAEGSKAATLELRQSIKQHQILRR